MKKFIAFMLMFMLALVFIGCGEETPDVVNPTKITLTAKATEINVDETIALTASFEPKEVTEKLIEWASSDPTIAQVSNGTVLGVAPGTVTITATSKVVPSVKATIEITVKEAVKVLPTALAISGTKTIVAGQESELAVTYTPENTTEKQLTWASSDPTIATVDEYGVVSGIAGGEVTITATSAADPNVSATVNVTVLSADEVVPVFSVTLSAASAELLLTQNQSKTLKVTAAVAAENAEEKPTITALTWTSSDETVATVSAYGTVTPVGVGTVTITATATDGSNVSGSIELTVVAAVNPETYEVSTTIGSEGLKIGRTTTIGIAVTPANADDTSVFVSSDESIATVDEFGVLTAIAVGEVTITATSALNPQLSGEVKIVINDGKVETEPTSVIISGETEVYVGYSINLVATVMPVNAVQTVVWTSSDESLATVDQNGTVLALKVGTVRIKAASTVNSKISFNYKIKIEEMPPVEPYPNMGGYEIIIMNADSALSDNDPFLEKYVGADKLYKQQAWTEVETNFNCKIKVVAYPSTAPWGGQRINWIKDNASANTSQCDLAVVSSNWIYDFAQASAAVNVKPYYDQYGLKQMEPSLRQAGSYKNAIYVASHGLSPTSTYVDLGLFYDLTWMQSLGVKDPAQMFLDGEWTYSGFEKWVLETQAKLNEGQFVFGGAPYYYYYGMTNAAGVKIADATLVQTNIASPKSKAAAELIYKLVEAGCCDEVISWAETDGGFIARTTLMTSGYLWFVRNDGRWKKDMFGDDTKYGYVPFPYPDDVAKEDTRIGVSGLSVLMYVAGRNYPAGVTTKEVYRAVNEMFLNTIKYQKADPEFDANTVKRNALQSRIDNPASIEAIMYYDASKVFYDPAHAIYSSTSATVLKTPANNAFYKGNDFDTEFDAVFNSFDTLFKSIYA